MVSHFTASIHNAELESCSMSFSSVFVTSALSARLTNSVLRVLANIVHTVKDDDADDTRTTDSSPYGFPGSKSLHERRKLGRCASISFASPEYKDHEPQPRQRPVVVPCIRNYHILAQPGRYRTSGMCTVYTKRLESACP